MALPLGYYDPTSLDTTYAPEEEEVNPTLYSVFKPCTVLSPSARKRIASVHMDSCQRLIDKSLQGIADGLPPRDISCSGRSRVFILCDSQNIPTGIFKTNPPITEIAASILTDPKRERIPPTTLLRIPPSSFPGCDFPDIDIVEGEVLGMFQPYIKGGDIHEYFQRNIRSCPSCHTKKFFNDSEYQELLLRLSSRFSRSQIHFMSIRDLLTYNTDRHCLNLRVDSEDNLWGIDHEEIWSSRRGGGKLWAWAFLPQIHESLSEELLTYLNSFEEEMHALTHFSLRIPDEFLEEYRERVSILKWAANSGLSIADMTPLIYALYRIKNLSAPHILPPANAVFNLFEAMIDPNGQDDLLRLLVRAVGDKKELPPFSVYKANFRYIKEEFLQTPESFLERALQCRNATENWVRAFWQMLET
ncbi:MAG: hypothetical protein ACI9YB_001298 [Halioglobus sp.]|jgi:hypothetical protein